MTTLGGVILLIGRILFVALFTTAARGHIQNHPRYVAGSGKKLPFPILAGWPAGVWLLVADLSIVVGIWPDIGALMIALFLIPAAVLVAIGLAGNAYRRDAMSREGAEQQAVLERWVEQFGYPPE